MGILKIIGIVIGGLAALWVAVYLTCWLVMIALCLPVSMKKEYTVPSKFYKKVMNFGYWTLLGCARVKKHATGLDKIPFGTRFLLVSNHRSSFDNMVQTYMLRPEQMAYITKKENFKIPIGRHYMKKLCYLALNREDIRSAIKVIGDAVNLIKNDYCSLGLFPEGTRTKNGLLGEFKAGCFKIALKAKCPIVITTTCGGEQVHKNWPWKRTHVYFDVLKVLPYEEFKDKSTVELAEMVRSFILDELKKKGAAAGPEYNEEYYHK